MGDRVSTGHPDLSPRVASEWMDFTGGEPDDIDHHEAMIAGILGMNHSNNQYGAGMSGYVEQIPVRMGPLHGEPAGMRPHTRVEHRCGLVRKRPQPGSINRTAMAQCAGDQLQLEPGATGSVSRIGGGICAYPRVLGRGVL